MMMMVVVLVQKKDRKSCYILQHHYPLNEDDGGNVIVEYVSPFLSPSPSIYPWILVMWERMKRVINTTEKPKRRHDKTKQNKTTG